MTDVPFAFRYIDPMVANASTDVPPPGKVTEDSQMDMAMAALGGPPVCSWCLKPSGPGFDEFMQLCHDCKKSIDSPRPRY